MWLTCSFYVTDDSICGSKDIGVFGLCICKHFMTTSNNDTYEQRIIISWRNFKKFEDSHFCNAARQNCCWRRLRGSATILIRSSIEGKHFSGMHVPTTQQRTCWNCSRTRLTHVHIKTQQCHREGVAAGKLSLSAATVSPTNMCSYNCGLEFAGHLQSETAQLHLSAWRQ